MRSTRWVIPRRHVRVQPGVGVVQHDECSQGLRAVHGAETVQEKVSTYYLADEITMTHRGMMIAIPEDEWTVFHDLTPPEMAVVLVDLASNVRLSLYPKQPRGPKKPKPVKQSGAEIKHVATARILKTRHSAQNDTFKGLPAR